VALLRRLWNTEVRNIFDTQIAAAFAGTTLNASYGKLLNEVLGVRLEKAAGFTHWDRRPLNEEQLAYAHKDVEHLPGLAEALRERLVATGRLEWAREEAQRLESASDVRDVEEIFRRLPRVNELSPADRAVAR